MAQFTISVKGGDQESLERLMLLCRFIGVPGNAELSAAYGLIAVTFSETSVSWSAVGEEP